MLLHRFRLLQATTALLYLGPLLAGLSGQGWPDVALFSAIFVLWSVILRPHLWPRTPADLARSEALIPLAALIATQVLLAALCFAMGRGIGGVTDFHPAIPNALPAVLSFLSIPLSRLVWNPSRQDRAGFDPLLHKPLHAKAQTLAPRLMAEVMALPDTVEEATLQADLNAIAAHIDALQIRRTLEEAAQTGQITRAGVKALIVHATDPDVAALLSGSAYPLHTFALARDDDILTLFATRATRMLAHDPTLTADCPDGMALTSAALPAGPQAHDALTRLAGLLRQGPEAVAS